MRILEIIIIILVFSSAVAAIAWYFVKSGKSDSGCGSCSCHKMGKEKDLCNKKE